MVEKQASSSTRSLRKGWLTATPVSSTATTLPAPVLPAALVLSAPINGMLSASDGRTGLSSLTLTTLGSLDSRSSPAWSTCRVVRGKRDSCRTTWPLAAASGMSARVLLSTFTLILPAAATRALSWGSI